MWVTAVLVFIATAFLAFALTTPNPLSIPIKPDAFKASQPGILAVTRHPILLGFALWVAAHIPPNGTLFAILLFEFAGLFSAASMFILEARRKRTSPAEDWQNKTAKTALLSWRLYKIPVYGLRWLIVAILYTVIIWLYPIAIGVSPLPL